MQHKNQKICVEWMHEGQAKECKDVRKEEYNHDLSEPEKKGNELLNANEEVDGNSNLQAAGALQLKAPKSTENKPIFLPCQAPSH